jgi:hypothetical protein
MIRLWKMTDAQSCSQDRTYDSAHYTHPCDVQWGKNITHQRYHGAALVRAEGGVLIEAYRAPALAVLFAPVSPLVGQPDCRLWEAETSLENIVLDEGYRVGVSRLTTRHEVTKPQISATAAVHFGLLCGLAVCQDLTWRAWAQAWLTGEERSSAAAREIDWFIRTKTDRAEGDNVADYAAQSAEGLALGFDWSDEMAAYAGRAAGQMGIDLITLAQEALAGLD